MRGAVHIIEKSPSPEDAPGGSVVDASGRVVHFLVGEDDGERVCVMKTAVTLW